MQIETVATMGFLAAFAACTTTKPSRPEAKQPSEPPAAIQAPPVAAEAPPVAVAVAAEPVSLRFTPVIEGDCPRLDVSLVGSEAFIHSQVGHYIARVLPDGATEDLSIDPTKFSGPPYDVEISNIEAVEGEWPDNLFVRYYQSGDRSWEGSRYLRRKTEGWWPLATSDEEAREWGADRLYRWTDGNWLARMSCRDDNDCKHRGMKLAVVRGPGKAPKFPELRSPPHSCEPSYTMTVLPGGEIVAVGRFCHKKEAEEGGAYYAIHWSEKDGTKTRQLALTPEQARSREPGPVVATSPTQVYAAILSENHEGPATVLAFDGAAWKELAPTKGPFGGMDVDRDGSVWLLNGQQLQRSAAGGAWEKLAFPTGPVKQVGGLRDAVAWVTQVDGTLWMRPDGQEFARVELPTPVFSTDAKYAVLGVKSAGRDVWVTASYTEKAPGWLRKEPRRAVLRNSSPREPQRCAQSPSYQSEKGMYAWPPAAREDCATPYAILIRSSVFTRNDFKYPTVGKALKGKQEFAAAKFSEVEVSGQRLVGAAVPSVAVGRALTTAIGKAIKGSRPELVCATPKELRPLPFDLATGKLAP